MGKQHVRFKSTTSDRQLFSIGREHNKQHVSYIYIIFSTFLDFSLNKTVLLNMETIEGKVTAMSHVI